MKILFRSSVLLVLITSSAISLETKISVGEIIEPEANLHPVAIKPTEAKKVDPFEKHVLAGNKWIELRLAYDKKSGIYQTFRAMDGNKKIFGGYASGAVGNVFRKAGSHTVKPHNHIGDYWVGLRSKKHVSRLYGVLMRYCLFYHNGHAVHACQSKDIKKLGNPASHGCTRVSPENAKKLFAWVGQERVAVKIIN